MLLLCLSFLAEVSYTIALNVMFLSFALSLFLTAGVCSPKALSSSEIIEFGLSGKELVDLIELSDLLLENDRADFLKLSRGNS